MVGAAGSISIGRPGTRYLVTSGAPWSTFRLVRAECGGKVLECRGPQEPRLGCRLAGYLADVEDEVRAMTLQQLQDDLERTSATLDTAGAGAEWSGTERSARSCSVA